MQQQRMSDSISKWRVWKLEAKVLIGVTTCSALCSLLLVLAACTNSWAVMRLLAKNQETVTCCQGLWKIKYTLSSTGRSYNYVLIHLFGDSFDRDVDSSIATMLRAAASFLGFGLLLSILSNCFAVYSMKHPRFTFKRAAAALFAMTMVCLIVCIDVYGRMMQSETMDGKLLRFPGNIEAAANLTDRSIVNNNNSDRIQVVMSMQNWRYGYSLIVVMVAAGVYGLAAILFLFYSRKLKGARAPNRKTAEANEEYLIGRVA